MVNEDEMLSRFARHINPVETVEIGEDKFDLKPLPWKFLPKVNKLIMKMARKTKSLNMKEGMDIDEMTDEQLEAAFNIFDEDNKDLIYELCFETMKVSYPKIDEKLLSDFASNNAIKLIQPIVKLNMPKQ
jgi:hypothetical protein